LWARSYERDLNDVLVLQADVSRDIAEAIRVKLTPQQRTALSAARTVDPDAYDAYLRGRYFLSSMQGVPFGSDQNIKKAFDYFQKAVAKDPHYAPAYAGLSDSYMDLAGESAAATAELMPKARTAALKAVELDPNLAEAHTALAGIKVNAWDWSGAETEFQTALALNPNYTSAHLGYGFVLTAMGRLDEAVQEAERARDIDPIDFGGNVSLAQMFYVARRYDDALRECRRGSEMYPDLGIFHWIMGQVYEQKKMFAEAYEQFHQSIILNKETDRAVAIEQAYTKGGYRGAVLQMIHFWDEPLKYSGSGDGFLAHHYAMIGDQANAMVHLERRFAEHDPGLAAELSDPAFDPLRVLPEFRDLARRMGLPQSVGPVPLKTPPETKLVGARQTPAARG
jgi:tetratricopeptide (TPR) repeat protein